MLVDPQIDWKGVDEVVSAFSHLSLSRQDFVYRVQEGVYLSFLHHKKYALDYLISFEERQARMKQCNPDRCTYFNGVADDVQQVLCCPQTQRMIDGPSRWVLSFEELSRHSEEQRDWRWHKWGPYIGVQEPRCEYLYDEPLIEDIIVWRFDPLEG